MAPVAVGELVADTSVCPTLTRGSTQEHHTGCTQPFESLVSVAVRSIPYAKHDQAAAQAGRRRQSPRKTRRPQMDYCSSCRRHLNGALVCPGCGAYAPDIAPPATHGRIGSAPAMTGAAPGTNPHRESTTSATWHDRPLDDEAGFNAVADAAPYALDVEEHPSPGQQGRAARRRQQARWKKNKRRAAVASAFAIVGGGLTIATMDRHSTDRAQAATAPDQRNTGAVEEQTPEQNPPESTPATTERNHRSSQTPSEPQPPTTNAPREQSLAAPPRKPPIARPDTAAPPRPAASSTPQPQNTAESAGETAPERSDATTEQPPPTADGTHSDASRKDPALISTSPSEVCVLMVCLG